MGYEIYSTGQYKVGVNIPAGEYYIKCDGSRMMYVEVASDSTGTTGSIICNLNTYGGIYLTIKNGEYLTVTGGNIYELNNTPNRGPENGYYNDGMYKVGEDIPEGEYNVESTMGLGYIQVSSDSRHTLNSIITNFNFENNKFITIRNGQYILLSNGARIKA